MSDYLKGTIANPDKIYGKSAYEIAVKYGYRGTEEEWSKEVEANRIAAEEARNVAEEMRDSAVTASKGAAIRADDAERSAQAAETSSLMAQEARDTATQAAKQAEQFADQAHNNVQTGTEEAVQAAVEAKAAAENSQRAYDVLKRSGRLVIGISGTHTLDDADILFGTNESDAAENSAKLDAALQKGGFTEIVFLKGDFYTSSAINPNNYGLGGIIRGEGFLSNIILTNDAGPDCVIYGCGSVIRDLTISCTPNVADYGRAGIYFDYTGASIVDHVYIDMGDKGEGVHIYNGDDIEISNCIITNMRTGIYVSDSRNITIRGCNFSACSDAIDATSTNINLHIRGNQFDGSNVRVWNAQFVDNEYNGGGCVNDTDLSDCYTMVGAAKLTEDKVNAVNKLPDRLGETWSVIVPNDYTGGMLSNNLTAGLYVVSIFFDEANDTPLASALFQCTDSDGTTLMTVYPMDDEFDYGVISVHLGNYDLYIQGESRLIEWLRGKKVTFTRIL